MPTPKTLRCSPATKVTNAPMRPRALPDSAVFETLALACDKVPLEVDCNNPYGMPPTTPSAS